MIVDLRLKMLKYYLILPEKFLTEQSLELFKRSK